MAVKKTIKAKKVVKKKVAPVVRKKQQSVSERLYDRNVQAGIVVVLLAFTLLLLLITYFSNS
ncbi:MAG TPA: hypothetical protein VLF89_06310 [Candidatus Saccharimonadales bacterium]|nr:hypothetical protein [Candidatus Saccharimonadales bacterium]